MKLPRDARSLEELFNGGTVPSPGEFNGQYTVDMLTGLPSMKWIGHRKEFFLSGGKPSGHNVFFRGWIWGRFHLGPATCRDMGNLPALLINYGRAGNSFVSRPMRDYVRRVDAGQYLGRLYYAVGGGQLFLGFFSLEAK